MIQMNFCKFTDSVLIKNNLQMTELLYTAFQVNVITTFDYIW